METRILKANLLLLITATIWGMAFVAQRIGMESVGPYTYNGIRFALGAFSLVPLMVILRKPDAPPVPTWPILRAGALAGTVLFVAASLQQVGLQYTTAGNAGFITGLYVVLVPLIGLLWRQRPDGPTWLGAILAAAGLWFLSVTEHFTIGYGDALELVGAFFWAGHVLVVGWLSPRLDALRLSACQFLVCSLYSLAVGVVTEPITWAGIWAAAIPILYGGLGSVGVAYTLQVVAQKDAKPAHAAIIMSMECPFAALGGWLILHESMTGRGLFGCGLMLTGMILSQLGPYLRRPKAVEAKPVSS